MTMAACNVAMDVPDLCAQLARPLGGVIHAAGVLRDGLLGKQSVAAAREVFAAKVEEIGRSTYACTQ